jgi:guanine nucleotide-binding protein subunit beta-like protein 1
MCVTVQFVSLQMEPPDPDYTLRGFDGPVTCLTFFKQSSTRQSDLLLAGTQTGSIYVWDLHRRRIVYHHQAAHSHTVLSIAVIGDTQEIISQGRDGAIYRWQMDSNKLDTKLGMHGN